MSTMKTLGLAIGVAVAVSSFAFGQQSNPAPNQQAEPSTNQPANPQTGYEGRRLYNYDPGMHCRIVHHPVTGRVMRICRTF